MKMTVLIAEDDPAMRHVLRKALEEITDVEVIGEAENGLEAVRLVKKLAPQVVFLDIAMPGKDGLEVAREVCEIRPKTMIIFATAFENYTHQAFEVYAFDYLIKPYKIDRIRKTMERISLKLAETEQAVTGFESPLKNETRPAKILVKEEGKKIFVNIKDIVFITREERCVVINTVGGKIKTSDTLEALEQQLSGDSFFRSHRGFIINLDMVKEIQPWGRKTCRVIMNNTKEAVMMTKDKSREIENKLRAKMG